MMVELASATGSPSLVMSVFLTSSTIAPPDLTVTPVMRERRVRVSPACASAW
jgi:S-adenosylhomocysteine hydrolase